MKTCARCSTNHPESFFNKDRTRPDGLYPWCKDCSRNACRTVYGKYHDKHVAMKRRWKAEERSKPQHRAQARAYIKAYREANPDYVAKWNRERRASVKRATPPWADLTAIKTFYAARPEGYHVDHIEPLHAADRSGLHVLWNLQYLPAEASLQKYNKVQ
jgi:hypothetical protein